MKANITSTFFLLVFFFIFSTVDAVAQVNENVSDVEITKSVSDVEISKSKEVSIVAVDNKVESLSMMNKAKSSFEITPMSKQEVLFLSGNSTKTYLLRTVHKKASRYASAVA